MTDMDMDQREYWERERVERERREDVADARVFWQNVFMAAYDCEGVNISIAVARADEALAAYRERFE